MIVRLAIDSRDVAAFQRDLFAIFVEYGGTTADEVQPHRRAAFEREMKRAGDTFKQCFTAEPAARS